MSHSGKPIEDHLRLDSLTDQLRDSLSSLEANKPDFRELDLDSPVSPLRARGLATTATTTTTTTTTSSSSSSSGSVSGTRNGLNPVAKSNHSGELCTSSETSPTAAAAIKTTRPCNARSDPLIYSGGISSCQSSVNSPPAVNMNVLPTGNICPSGKILKTGMTMTNRSSKTDVLGSGTGNYGHGSIMRGGGGVKCTSSEGGNSVSISSSVCNTSSVRGNAGVGRGFGIMGGVDPEEVKRAGNEMYKKGHFSEALALYDKAIALAPANAAYRSNRAAALMGLGRVAEAARECEEAVRLDPNYWRAHQRLGSLLIR